MPDSVESLQRLALFVMGRPHLIWGLLGADSPNALAIRQHGVNAVQHRQPLVGGRVTP